MIGCRKVRGFTCDAVTFLRVMLSLIILLFRNMNITTRIRLNNGFCCHSIPNTLT